MSPVYPSWFLPSLSIFEDIRTLLMVVLGLLIVETVRRPGLRVHLQWAMPAAGASISAAVGSLLRLFSFGGNALQATFTANTLSLTFHILAIGLSLYSVWMLWRTLYDIAHKSASADSAAQTPASPDVWPPPPTRPVR